MAVADFLSRNGGGGGAAGWRAPRPETFGGGMWRGGHGNAKGCSGRTKALRPNLFVKKYID